MLRQVVGALPDHSLKGLLVGLDSADDAAVYQLTPERAIVSTIDVITPIVDDPATFGRIAAANAFSDVYAMGARPLISLSFLSSVEALPISMVQDMIRGAGEFALGEGAPIVGGHSVEGKDLLLGLVVIGEIHPDQIWTKGAAKPGDALYLSKPLGTGTLTTAVKRGVISLESIQDAVIGMASSNGVTAALAREFKIRSATDITGFGLAGHLAEMAAHSGARFDLECARLPAYTSAIESLASGVITRGNARNEAYVQSLVSVEGDIPPLALDPQTSGGLVLAVDQNVTTEFERRAQERKITMWRIGKVSTGSGLAFY